MDLLYSTAQYCVTQYPVHLIWEEPNKKPVCVYVHAWYFNMCRKQAQLCKSAIFKTNKQKCSLETRNWISVLQSSMMT